METTIRWKLKRQINKSQLRSNSYQNLRDLGAKLISKNHFGPHKVINHIEYTYMLLFPLVDKAPSGRLSTR